MTEDPLDPGGANPWQTLSTSVVYDNGRLRVREDRVVQPDGLPGRYTFIEIPHQIVAIVPVTRNAQAVYLVRQWRYPWGRNSWEIPAGTCEPGEDALQGAQRELAEEIGMRPGRLDKLAEFYNSPGFCDEYTHLYAALDLEEADSGAAVNPEEREMTLERVRLADVDDLIARGRLVDAKSIIGLLLTRRYLAGEYSGFRA
jgi:ADP-ribose pyrophosphatase